MRPCYTSTGLAQGIAKRPAPGGSLQTESIRTARFAGDAERVQAILADPDLKAQLQRTEVLRQKSLIRTRLLSDAVRVNARFVPSVAESIARLGQHLQSEKQLEAYVFADPSVNAFVTEGSKRLILGLSSGAVGLLTAPELEFIIGHELGHLVYGHLEVPAEIVIDVGHVRPDQTRLLRAWQRASEISADRAGLVLCDSLEVAARALFKTLAGLSLPGVEIDPRELAAQWEGLAEEILDYGGGDHWQMAHPFPPLRMRALALYWEKRDEAAPEAEIERMLALMDDPQRSATAPASSSDPMLARFHFWGGLYVALSDGPLQLAERDLLVSLAPPGTAFDEALKESMARHQACMDRFAEAGKSRQTKLSSSELHRIMQGLIHAARVDGPLNQLERDSLYQLGETIGLRRDAFNIAIEKAERG